MIKLNVIMSQKDIAKSVRFYILCEKTVQD